MHQNIASKTFIHRDFLDRLVLTTRLRSVVQASAAINPKSIKTSAPRLTTRPAPMANGMQRRAITAAQPVRLPRPSPNLTRNTPWPAKKKAVPAPSKKPASISVPVCATTDLIPAEINTTPAIKTRCVCQ